MIREFRSGDVFVNYGGSKQIIMIFKDYDTEKREYVWRNFILSDGIMGSDEGASLLSRCENSQYVGNLHDLFVSLGL